MLPEKTELHELNRSTRRTNQSKNNHDKNSQARLKAEPEEDQLEVQIIPSDDKRIIQVVFTHTGENHSDKLLEDL